MFKRRFGHAFRIALAVVGIGLAVAAFQGGADRHTRADSLQQAANLEQAGTLTAGAGRVSTGSSSGAVSLTGDPASDPAFLPAGDSNLFAELTGAANQSDQEKDPASTAAGLKEPANHDHKSPAAPAPTGKIEASAAVSASQLAAVSAGPAGETSLTQPAQTTPYTLGQAFTRNLRVRIQISNRGGETSQNIRLEVPLLANLNTPYQARVNESFSQAPVEISEGAFGIRSAHFVIPSLTAGETVTITLDYSVRVNPFTANFSAYTGAPTDAGETGYLQPSPGIESNHNEIVSKAAEVTAGAANNLERARAIYRFVLSHMRYDAGAATRNQGALAALRNRTGVCEDYATLFVALARASGIPARQVNGYTDPRGTGDIWNLSSGALSLRGYRHSWAEFYLEGLGWLPADPTMDLNSSSWQYFGSLPRPSHIAQNYLDHSMRVKFQGGQLAATWEEELVR